MQCLAEHLNVFPQQIVEMQSAVRMKTNGAASRENLFLGFSTRSDTNRAVQLQKMARDLKFRI